MNTTTTYIETENKSDSLQAAKRTTQVVIARNGAISGSLP